jgi:hypothetical protein
LPPISLESVTGKPRPAAICVAIRTALVKALDARGLDGKSCVPSYFPTPGDYATRLERAGFRVDSIALFPRPTPLPGEMIGWLETFGESFTSVLRFHATKAIPVMP